MAGNSILGLFVIDFICLALVWIPVLLLDQIGKPFRRGFFCDDDSIRHPYHDGTISNIVLYVVGVLLPVITMIVVEIVRCRYGYAESRREGAVGSLNKTPAPSSHGFSLGRLHFPPVVVELCHLIAIFLFGAGCSQIATDIGKYSIGRLRPHFIDVCRPNLDLLCPAGQHGKYIVDFECTGTDAEKLKDARLSFPSGHASFSAYTMLYVALYLQARMTWRGSHLLRPFLQLVFLMFTWYTGLSRVSDYKHHWSDVLSGFLIGAVAASLTALYVSPLFNQQRKNENQLLPVSQRDIGLVNYNIENADSN